VRIPGVQWLPLDHGFVYDHYGLGYRVVSDDRIEVLHLKSNDAPDDFPYEAYPAAFPQTPSESRRVIRPCARPAAGNSMRSLYFIETAGAALLVLFGATGSAVSTETLIRHGIDVGPETVGLRGAGVREQDLTPKRGGKASALANTKDEVTGRPMLRRLDITGQVTIDVPCVIAECRLTQTGGLYGVRSTERHEYEVRDCDLECRPDAAGKTASCVLLRPTVVRRSVVRGGEDGIKIGAAGGCLVEDTWVHGLVARKGTHNDAVQMTGTVEPDMGPDRWVFRRCRFEGRWRAQTSAMILQAKDQGPIHGVTVEDCLLSGGAYSLYTRRSEKFEFTGLHVRGNVFADGSSQFGPWSNDVNAEELSSNRLAPATSETSPVAVDLSRAQEYAGGKR
jgi:hypothetical protein